MLSSEISFLVALRPMKMKVPTMMPGQKKMGVVLLSLLRPPKRKLLITMEHFTKKYDDGTMIPISNEGGFKFR